MFLHPLGLLALLGVPAVVALHLFRRRFRPRVVSALYLWVDRDETLLAGRRRERLRTSASFWLELATVLLLGLVFAGPKACGTGEAEHLVCVLDASASMGAEESGAPGGSLRDAAVELVRDRIGDLPARSKVTLITSGARPALIAGPAAFPAEARAALDGYHPSTARHDLTPAVALGQQLAGEGAVLVVSDHFNPDLFPPEVELISIGAPIANVAITHATRARELATGGAEVDRVLVTLAALSDSPAERDLTITADGRTLESERVLLEPDQRRHFAFEVSPGTGEVVVRLAPDALAIDDVAFLAPDPPRTLALAIDLDPQAARALGFTSGASASLQDRLLELIPHATSAPDPESAHLVVGHAPDAGGARTWTLSLEGELGIDAKPRDLIGPFLTERRHPLLDGVTLEGIVWSVTPEHALGGMPLVSAGDLPILTETLERTRRAYRLNLDPYRSTLQNSPDWPILLANLAELRRAELPGPRRANVAVGDAFVFRGSGTATYRVRALSGSAPDRDVAARELLVLDDLTRPGFYALERLGDDVLTPAREVARFGVSFRDAEESDLRGMRPGEEPPEAALAGTLSPLGPLETLLLVGALVCIVVDWWVLRALRMRTQPLLTGAAGSEV